MIKAAVVFHELVEYAFAFVAEGAVAEIVGKADTFGKIFVGAEGAGEGTTDGGHLHGMGEAGAEVIGDAVDEDLRLIFKATEAATMEDAVAVAGKTGSGSVGCLGVMPTKGFGAEGGIGA